MQRPRQLARLTGLLRSATRDLLDQSEPFGRLALVHVIFSGATALVTISLAGSLFFSISPHAAKDKVVLYLLLTIAPFAVVAPALSPLLDRGSYARRTSLAVASVGSAVLCWLMAGDLQGLLLFPLAFGVLVLSKLYLVAKAALVPSMTETKDDLAGANAKLAVLASLSGFVASPIGVGILQIGAQWVLRLAFVIFVCGGVAVLRLPRPGDATRPAAPPAPYPTARGADGRALLGPPRPPPVPEPLAAESGSPGARRGERIDVARERQRLGLPLFVPEVMLGRSTMAVIRGAVGFMTFFLAFALRSLHAATWWYGVVLLTSGIGSLLGSLAVPKLRRRLSEQQLMFSALVLGCLAGIATGLSGSLLVQPVLTFAMGFVALSSKPAFDSIVQRHVAPALLGRAFARFETQLQLVWVLCAFVAVVIGFPLRSGDVLIGAILGVAAIFNLSMRRAVSRPARTTRRTRSKVRARP